MPYIWTIEDDYPERLLGTYDRDRGPDRFEFKQGKECQTGPSQTRYFFNATIKSLRSRHDLGNNALVPLVCPDIANVLCGLCENQVQLIPAEIVACDGVIKDYSIVVATHKVRGLNHAESSYTHIPGSKAIMRFRKAVYQEGCMGELDIARDEEYLSNLLISTQLHDALQRFDGLGLYSPSEMKW